MDRTYANPILELTEEGMPLLSGPKRPVAARDRPCSRLFFSFLEIAIFKKKR